MSAIQKNGRKKSRKENDGKILYVQILFRNGFIDIWSNYPDSMADYLLEEKITKNVREVEMTLFEALRFCGNRYSQYIQLGWVGGRRDGERSGVMKKGNITYTKLDHYSYGYEVKYIFPKVEKDKEILFLQLWEVKNQ